ncbi:MAG: pilus assembly protein N-terminal domain-containing protein, partial [Mameliella sp.]|nr:pilus assembly protein N-terminal domain-containing protein [Mameliella sp.]
MFRKFSIMALAASFAFCGAAPISAQDAGFEIIGAADTIEVKAKQAVTLAFDDAYAELSIGDPEIADISSLSGTLVYLLGKEVGETTLTVIRDRDSLDLTHMTVVVYRDIAPMQGFLEKAG